MGQEACAVPTNCGCSFKDLPLTGCQVAARRPQGCSFLRTSISAYTCLSSATSSRSPMRFRNSWRLRMVASKARGGSQPRSIESDYVAILANEVATVLTQRKKGHHNAFGFLLVMRDVRGGLGSRNICRLPIGGTKRLFVLQYVSVRYLERRLPAKLVDCLRCSLEIAFFHAPKIDRRFRS